MRKAVQNSLIELFFLLIITIPSFLILLNNQYFSMHDDQHIVRLYLLDQGLRQGNLYPRWVDGLGFGYGYPLFNFYPPLIYYIAEFFHLTGFSYIWSIKLMIVAGFILAALGSFLLIKRLIGRWPAVLGATLYTYFFYHSITVYVRGALAEFFTMAIIPFVFLFIDELHQNNNLKNCIFFGLSLALLILTHPLIAFPSLLFLGIFFLFYLAISKNRVKFITLFITGLLIGLTLSSFFWLPSLIEKKYTLIDTILVRELADYKKHFVCPYQFWYSPWGYGGSGENCQSGLTFQLGKIPIALTILSILFFIIYYFYKKKNKGITSYYLLFIFFLIFSLFMATGYSSLIWQKINYLAYLQWPWRFLTFSAFFISVIGSYNIYFFQQFFKIAFVSADKWLKIIVPLITIISCAIIILKYQQYFRPQKLITTNDRARTNFEEIAWRVSSTSYEFIPKGVATKKSPLGTTMVAINKVDLPRLPYKIISGEASVIVNKNNFSEKLFTIDVKKQAIFRLNTFDFPGWQAFLDGQQALINSQNDLRLITIQIGLGKHDLRIIFSDTPVRQLANNISIISAFATTFLIIKLFFSKKNAISDLFS